jgi:hypothetical protein
MSYYNTAINAGWTKEDAKALEAILKQDEKRGFEARTIEQQNEIERLHAKYQR